MKCVFVVGREDTGSTLIAKITAQLLDCGEFGEWDGVEWIKGENGNRVFHGSLPNGSYYPDFDKLEKENSGCEFYYILTTRDQTLQKVARINRFKKPLSQEANEKVIAERIISDILTSDKSIFIWNYETFMFLKILYIGKLLNFLGLNNIHIDLEKIGLWDANPKRIKEYLSTNLGDD